MTLARAPNPRLAGRYAICDEFASGGMATVHFGRLVGPAGFARTVAIKCLHPQFARDPNFVSMLLDEARLAARVHDPHVVPILDVVSSDTDLFLVMEYVHGESLSQLMRLAQHSGRTLPVALAVAVLAGVLRGLHAAHLATDEAGHPLGIIHRDVSPQNVLVGVDGLPRITDFGIAKAAGRLQSTVEGQLKGKLNYMAPEQYASAEIDQRVDVYSAAVVLWEALTGQRLFQGDRPASIMHRVLTERVQLPSSIMPGVPPEIDAIVMRGLAHAASDRFSTASEMAAALERSMPLPCSSDLGEWVASLAHAQLERRAALRASVESAVGSQAARAPTQRRAVPAAGDSIADLETASETFDERPAQPEASAPQKPPQRSRSKDIIAVASGVFIALIAAGLAVFVRSSNKAEASLAASSHTASAAPHEAVAPASSPVPAPSESVAPALSASAQTKKAARPPWTQPTATAACTPPYWVDADGIRHPKPDCLRRK